MINCLLSFPVQSPKKKFVDTNFFTFCDLSFGFFLNISATFWRLFIGNFMKIIKYNNNKIYILFYYFYIIVYEKPSNGSWDRKKHKRQITENKKVCIDEFLLDLATEKLSKQFIIFNQNLKSCKRLKKVTYLSDRFKGGMQDTTKQWTNFYYP
jgi:hypothetical protein